MKNTWIWKTYVFLVDFSLYVKENVFWIQKVIDFMDYKMQWLNYIKPSTGILFIKKDGNISLSTLF